MALFKRNEWKMWDKVTKLTKKKNVRGLIKALSYEDYKHDYNHVRKKAVDALGEILDVRAVEPLIATLQDRGKEVREAAQAALVKLGALSVELLAPGLSYKDSGVQRLVAEALVRIGDVRPVELLIVHLKQGCVPAATALGEIGDVRAVEPLIVALNNGNDDMPKEAAKALSKIGDVRAVEPFVATLKDSDSHVRGESARALGKIGDIRAVGPLVAALKDWDFDVRKAAQEALVKLGPASVSQLIAALSDSDVRAREHAARVLGEIGDIQAVEPLNDALRDKEVSVRGHAAEAMGKICDVRAVEPLIGALRDKESSVRGWVAYALRHLYQANTIDDNAKRKILAVHKFMPNEHTDQHRDGPGGEGCYSQHGDYHSDYSAVAPL
jgi:HEAT repeat protein